MLSQVLKKPSAGTESRLITLPLIPSGFNRPIRGVDRQMDDPGIVVNLVGWEYTALRLTIPPLVKGPVELPPPDEPGASFRRDNNGLARRIAPRCLFYVPASTRTKL